MAAEKISAYVGSGTVPGYGAHVRPLTDWHGKKIGVVWPVSKWKTPKSYVSSEMFQYEAEVDGVRYTGREPGEGMYVNLKRKAKRR